MAYLTKEYIAVKNRFVIVSVDPLNDATGQEIFGANQMLGAFKSIGGLELETEFVEWKTGDMNNTFKLPGTTKYPAIVLARGLDNSNLLKRWYNLVWNSLTGGATTIYYVPVRILILARNSPEIVNAAGVTAGKLIVRSIRVEDAWPAKYSLDELDAMSNDPLLESVELQHGGWSYEDVSPDMYYVLNQGFDGDY